jgi:hypothetical protein
MSVDSCVRFNAVGRSGLLLFASKGCTRGGDSQHVLDRRVSRAAEAGAYWTIKGTAYALTLAMAADHVREGIRVDCVALSMLPKVVSVTHPSPL